MSIDTVRKTLEEELDVFWTNRTPIFWDNIDLVPNQGESFIRPTISNYDSEIISMACQRDYYLFSIQVLTAKDLGSGTCMRMTDELRKHFFKFSQAGVICKKSNAERVGNEKQWYQYNVDIEVQYDNYF